jgi:hypothetical protein
MPRQRRPEAWRRASAPATPSPMRTWLFHPLAFYPLLALLAALVVGFSLRPQSWPREPAAVAGVLQGEALVLEGAAFNAPDAGAEQAMTVRRDFWGRPQSLLIAQLPGQPPPTPAEKGALILLTPERLALIEDKPLLVEVQYLPLPVNAASGLAVSVQGIGPAEWVPQDAPAQPGTLRFELPPQFAATGIGLRALSSGADQNYGLEITSVRILPQPPPPPEPALDN